MALENNERGNFISIVGGKIAQRVPEGTPGAVSRVMRNGETAHEKYYDSFTGKLVGIKTKDGNFGKQWYFSFQDKGEIYILALPYEGGQAIAILKMLPNVDVTKEIKLSASVSKNDKGNDVTSIFINQGGNAIKHYYKKETPNGLPSWAPVMVNNVQVELNGQKVWDKNAQMSFFENMVNTVIIPKLPAQEVATNVQPENGVQTATSLADFDDTAEGEDVPF